MKSSSFSELKSHLIGDQAESSRTSNWNHSRTYDQNAVSKPKDLSDRFTEQFLDEQFQRPESFSMKDLAKNLCEDHQYRSVSESWNSKSKLLENSWLEQFKNMNINNIDTKHNQTKTLDQNSDQIWMMAYDKLQTQNNVLENSAWLNQYKINTERFENKSSTEDWTGQLQQENDFWSQFEQQSDFNYNKLELPIESMTATQGDVFTEYQLSANNPMLTAKNALEIGKRKLSDGDYSGAVLCFEAACQQDMNSTEAWLLLGQTQAQNEQDVFAIQALRKCLDLDSGNLDALTAISCCYTNESYYTEAYDALRAWLFSNDKYNQLMHDYDSNWDQLRLRERHDLLEKMFLRIIESNISQNTIDSDVQSSLGVLLNLSGDYDKAIDCFETAIQIHPDNATLWNRLGATLANGNRGEEAIAAYRNALQLSPGFVRARYNVGITCVSLSAYTEAIEHFLTALNLQMKAKGVEDHQKTNQMSESIWSTLKTCLILMGRTDCLSLANDNNLDELNRVFQITD